MNNKFLQTELAHIFSLVYLAVSFIIMALLSLHVTHEISAEGLMWKYVLTIVLMLLGIFTSYQSICLSRIWTTGETGDNSCPFYILKQFYSGNWEDRGGQERRAKTALKKSAMLIVIVHTVAYIISYVALNYTNT